MRRYNLSATCYDSIVAESEDEARAIFWERIVDMAHQLAPGDWLVMELEDSEPVGETDEEVS